MQKNNTLLKLEEYMQQKQWSIYKLAKESDIPYSSLNNLFQRNTEPTLSTLRKICVGLNISMSDFFSDEYAPDITDYTADERHLLALYRSLKSADKKLLITFAQGLGREIPN